MMDTILNLGLTDQTVQALAANTKILHLPMIATVALSKCMGMLLKGSIRVILNPI